MNYWEIIIGMLSSGVIVQLINTLINHKREKTNNLLTICDNMSALNSKLLTEVMEFREIISRCKYRNQCPYEDQIDDDVKS